MEQKKDQNLTKLAVEQSVMKQKNEQNSMGQEKDYPVAVRDSMESIEQKEYKPTLEEVQAYFENWGNPFYPFKRKDTIFLKTKPQWDGQYDFTIEKMKGDTLVTVMKQNVTTQLDDGKTEKVSTIAIVYFTSEEPDMNKYIKTGKWVTSTLLKSIRSEYKKEEGYELIQDNGKKVWRKNGFMKPSIKCVDVQHNGNDLEFITIIANNNGKKKLYRASFFIVQEVKTKVVSSILRTHVKGVSSSADFFLTKKNSDMLTSKGFL
jgi:hypothetical protein